MNVLGISPNISFIYPYFNNEPDYQNSSNFIGFRYYENGSYKEGNFFTLIKKNKVRYFILEKNKSIKDINNDLFYDENLNCFDIAKRIIFNKHKESLIGSIGDLFPELIGYCYALASLGKIKHFKLMEPLISDLNQKDCIVDNIPELIEGNDIYIEPFIYDGHISLIIAIKDNSEFLRYNIIFDMSSYHFEEGTPNFIFLPNSLKRRNIIYPNSPIQAYSSCCLWFYGEIECLLKMDKYISAESILMSVKESNLCFYIDVINFLSKEFQDIDCLIKVEKGIYSIEKPNDIELDRLCFDDGEKCYSIHKDAIYSKFLDIDKFTNNLGKFMPPSNKSFLKKLQRVIMNCYELKNILIFNLKYYNLLPKSEVLYKGMESLSSSLSKIDKLISFFKEQYDNVFFLYNIYFLEGNNEDTELLNKISKPFIFTEYRKTKIYDCGGFDFFLENFLSD